MSSQIKQLCVTRAWKRLQKNPGPERFQKSFQIKSTINYAISKNYKKDKKKRFKKKQQNKTKQKQNHTKQRKENKPGNHINIQKNSWGIII